MKPEFPFKIFNILFVCGIMTGAWSCGKHDVYPAEPHIEFLGFEQSADSAVFRFSFTDGDGDIGLSDKLAEDNKPPFDSAGAHKFNFKMLHQHLDTLTGKYEYTIIPGTLHDTLHNSLRIDRIKKIGSDKSLNGEIQITIAAPYTLDKYFRYECQLEDRALNKSNLLVSPTFTLFKK